MKEIASPTLIYINNVIRDIIQGYKISINIIVLTVKMHISRLVEKPRARHIINKNYAIVDNMTIDEEQKYMQVHSTCNER